MQSLIVEGTTLPRSSLPRSGSAASYGTALSSTPNTSLNASSSSALPSASSPPLFRSVIASRKSPSSFNLKVVKAEMKRNGRKIEFKPKQQTFIEIVETTANVEHILGVVRRRWGPDYVMVTQDGLEVEDAPATQGVHVHARMPAVAT